jgi:hypothetical protein
MASEASTRHKKYNAYRHSILHREHDNQKNNNERGN